MSSLIENSDNYFSLKKLFKKIDMTGVNYEPKIFKTKKYVSIPGSIITLTCISILVYSIILSIKTILNRTNFKVTTERGTELNTTFTVYNLSLQLCLLDDIEFQRLGIFTNYYEEVYPTKTSLEIMDNFYLPCYNYDFNNNSFLTTNEVFQTENIYNAYFIVPNDTYFFDLFLIYNITYINPNDYFHPTKIKGDYMILGSIDENPKNIDFKLEKIKVVHQHKIFSLFYDTINKKEEEFSSLSSYVVSNENGNYYNLKIGIDYTGWVTTYTFIGYNIEEEVCSIGGLINVIMIIQSFLGKFINNYFLDKEIRYHTKFSEKSYNAVINIKKSDNVLSNAISNFHSENVKINTNYNITEKNKIGISIFKIKNDSNNASNNKILKIKDEDSVKQSNKKMIEANSNINILNSNKSTKSKLLHKYHTLKKKTKNLLEYKQFIQILDYYVIYQIIKDVNILKLLCLNNITAQIFYKYRHRNINVSNLDYIMEKETRIKVNTNLNDDNSLFNNINEKLILLNSYG